MNTGNEDNQSMGDVNARPNLTRRVFMAASASGVAAAWQGAASAQPADSGVESDAEKGRKRRLKLTRAITSGLRLSYIYNQPLEDVVQVMIARIPTLVDDGLLSDDQGTALEKLGEDLIKELRQAFPFAPSMTYLMRLPSTEIPEDLVTKGEEIGELGIITPWATLHVIDIFAARAAAGLAQSADQDVPPEATAREATASAAARNALLDGTYSDGDTPIPRDPSGRKWPVWHDEQLGNMSVDDFYTTPKRLQPGYRRHVISLSKQSGMLGNFTASGGGDDEQSKANNLACYEGACVENTGTYCGPAESGTGCDSMSDNKEE